MHDKDSNKSWKVLVLEELSNGRKDWDGLLEKTGLSPNNLKTALRELFELEYIYKDEWGSYHLNSSGKAFLKKKQRQKRSEEKKKKDKQVKDKSRTGKISNDLGGVSEWMRRWLPVESDDGSKELATDHFFLGPKLSFFLSDAIEESREEMIIVNPFVGENTVLTILLRRLTKAGRKAPKVLLVTGDPLDDPRYFTDARKEEAVKTLERLRKAGAKIVYRENIHAKVFLIDGKIGVVSSMNLYSGSVGGRS